MEKQSSWQKLTLKGKVRKELLRKDTLWLNKELPSTQVNKGIETQDVAGCQFQRLNFRLTDQYPRV